MTEQKWIRSSLRHVAARLKQKGKTACAVTTGRLLRKHKYAPRVNEKRVAGASHPDRNRQSEYLTAQKQTFLDAGQPVISSQSSNVLYIAAPAFSLERLQNGADKTTKRCLTD